jgi:hypothetical protein
VKVLRIQRIKRDEMFILEMPVFGFGDEIVKFIFHDHKLSIRSQSLLPWPHILDDEGIYQ